MRRDRSLGDLLLVFFTVYVGAYLAYRLNDDRITWWSWLGTIAGLAIGLGIVWLLRWRVANGATNK